MANANLFIYQLLNNVDAKIKILGLSKDIVAYTTQEFGFSGSAHWSGRDPNSYMEKANQAEKIGVETYNRTLGRFFGEATTGMTTDIAGSLLNYQGTDNVGFTLDMYFVAMRAGDDVRTNLGILGEGIFPEFGEGVGGLQRVYAPNAFKKGANINTVDGAISVEIGRWFRTPQIFVMTSMNFNLSKETIPSGSPLFAHGNVQFQCARVMSATEVKKMFYM